MSYNRSKHPVEDLRIKFNPMLEEKDNLEGCDLPPDSGYNYLRDSSRDDGYYWSRGRGYHPRRRGGRNNYDPESRRQEKDLKLQTELNRGKQVNMKVEEQTESGLKTHDIDKKETFDYKSSIASLGVYWRGRNYSNIGGDKEIHGCERGRGRGRSHFGGRPMRRGQGSGRGSFRGSKPNQNSREGDDELKKKERSVSKNAETKDRERNEKHNDKPVNMKVEEQTESGLKTHDIDKKETFDYKSSIGSLGVYYRGRNYSNIGGDKEIHGGERGRGRGGSHFGGRPMRRGQGSGRGSFRGSKPNQNSREGDDELKKKERSVSKNAETKDGERNEKHNDKPVNMKVEVQTESGQKTHSIDKNKSFDYKSARGSRGVYYSRGRNYSNVGVNKQIHGGERGRGRGSSNIRGRPMRRGGGSFRGIKTYKNSREGNDEQKKEEGSVSENQRKGRKCKSNSTSNVEGHDKQDEDIEYLDDVYPEDIEYEVEYPEDIEYEVHPEEFEFLDDECYFVEEYPGFQDYYC